MTRQNLLYNPSFRLGLSGYQPLNNAGLSIVSADGFYGADYLQVTKAANNASGVQYDPTALPTADLHDELPYSFSSYVRVPIVTPSTEPAALLMQVVWLNAQDTVLATSSSSTVTVSPSDSWTRLTGITVRPDGATSASVTVMQLLAGTAGAVFQLDASLLEQSAYVGGYLDNLDPASRNRIINAALTPLSAKPTATLELNADVIFNDLVLNTIDEDNIVWVCTDIDGWWTPAEPEIPDIPRGVEDGSYDVSGRYQARTFTLDGVFMVTDPAQISVARDKLIKAINIVRTGGWLRTNEEPTKAAFVRLSGRPTITTVNARGRTEFSIGLKAADPIKYLWNDADVDGFTTVTPFVDPEAAQTNLATNPSFETASGTVTVRTNLATNPSAAIDLRTMAMAGAGGVTLTRDTTEFHERAASVKVVTDGSVLGQGVQIVNETTSRPAGTYTGSAWVKGPAGLLVYGILRMSAGDTSTPNIALTGEWQRIAAPPQTTLLDSPTQQFMIRQPSAGTPATFYVTEALLEASPVLDPYFDGSTPAAGDFSYAWTGAVNASISVQTALRAANWNLVQSPSAHSVAYKSLDEAETVLHFSRPDWDSINTYRLLLGELGAFNSFTTGDTVTVFLRVKASKPVSLRVAILASNGLGPGDGHNMPVTEEWEWIPWAFVLSSPPNGSHGVYLSPDGATYGIDLDISKIMIIEGEYSGPYFDGDTDREPYYLHSWTGTPHASTSRRFLGSTVTADAENLGTSDVTAVFDLTGPLGVGSTVYNPHTEETIPLASELRGTGTLVTLVSKQLLNNKATLTTTAPHKLLVGDLIHVSGVGAPFDSVHEDLEVTDVGLIPPYSFSYKRVFPDIDEVGTSGTVSLAHNDVLSVDTYNRSVIFNGSSLGSRSRVDTLTDWTKLAPGHNLIDFTDNPVHRKVINKQLIDDKVTLKTTDSHLFLPGEVLVVDLPTEAELALKSLTNNRITLTTTEPHGFSKGDTVAVVSTETSVITDKEVTSNVGTLTTQVAGGFSVGDQISVTLPTTQAITTKAVAGNVVTLSTPAPHGFSVGDHITVALGTGSSPLRKSLTNNVATITTAAVHGFSVGDHVTVSFSTGTTVTSKYVNASQVSLTTASAHGFAVGDSIIVSLPETATLAGTRSMAGSASYLTTLHTAAAHNFSVGDRVSIDIGITSTLAITAHSATTTTCTLTTATHNFAVGETIVVWGLSSRYNGTFTISSVTATTITYAHAGATDSGGAGGSVTNTTISLGYNGIAVIETIPSSTSFTYLYYGQDVVTTSTALGSTPTASNLSNAVLNGTRTITSVSATQLTYTI